MATYTDWPDGKRHSIPYAQHLINMRAAAGNPLSLPDPPPGTYDPSIDYNAGAAQRGYSQTVNDAQTAYEQGQQDYGVGVGDLTRGRDRGLADLLTSQTRLEQDYSNNKGEIGRQYGILGRQQAEQAAQRGITSAGLLGQSNAVRGENQTRDVTNLARAYTRNIEDLDTQRTRIGQDFDRGKLGLDLGNARTFGGFNGQTILNPITGQPEFGSLITGVTRAGAENTAYQTAASQQRAAGAQAMGYVSPLTQSLGNGMRIGSTPLTAQMWQNGLLVDSMLANQAAIDAKKKTKPKTGRTVNGVWTPEPNWGGR